MTITPDASKELAKSVRDMYLQAEIELLQQMAQGLEKGIDLPEWKATKIKELKKVREGLEDTIRRLGEDIEPLAYNITMEAYINGRSGVDDNLQGQGLDIKEGFGKVSQHKVEALAKALSGNLKDIHPMILRRANDIYKRVMTEATTQVATGAMTRRQATQQALNRFADQGVGGFVDSLGRRWSMPSYAEMATRSGLVQANLAGTIDRMDELGHNLVIVSEHAEECPICRPWEGKVLRLR